MWVLFWSLFLGGLNIHLAGREPVLLYFDAVLVFWLIYQILWGGFMPKFSGWIMRLGVFCLLCQILSTLVNYQGIYKSLASIKILACGLLIYAIARKATPSLLTLSLWGALVGALLLINFQNIRFGEYESEASLKDVVGIVLGRSNYVASILLLLIPLALAAVSLHKGKLRLIFAACAMLMFAGLIATMSRGALLAILIATTLSLPLLYKAGLRLKHTVVVLGLGVAVFFVLPSDLVSVDAALIAARMDSPDLGREEVMAASWHSFKDHALLGVGPGQLGNAMMSHMTVAESDQPYMNAHNLVLNALGENGLPAGLALLTMVGIVLYRAFMTAVSTQTALSVAIWLALLSAVIHNMVEASFEGQHFQVVFWTVAAMAEIGYRRLSVPLAAT